MATNFELFSTNTTSGSASAYAYNRGGPRPEIEQLTMLRDAFSTRGCAGRHRDAWLALLASALAGFFSATTRAGTLYVATCGNDTWTAVNAVCSSPDGPKRHIQSAIDSASDGDEIIVAAGTYKEPIDFKGKAIYLHSADGADATTLDGTGLKKSIITCTSGETAETILDGFTITKGAGTAINNNFGGYDYKGGGMYIDSCSPTIRNCIFARNTVGNTSVNGYARGGGVYNRYANPTIEDCTFSENKLTAMDGWSTYGAGIYATYGAPIVRDCVFSSNRAEAVGVGGGMSMSGGTVTGCTFNDNYAVEGYAGGLLIGADPIGIVSGCDFRNNTSARGGALTTGGDGTLVTDCTFTENAATIDGGGEGGAVFAGNTGKPKVTFQNCTFTYNSSHGAGGAIYDLYCDLTVIDCVFESNLGELDGGAMYNDSETTVTLSRCMFLANSAGFYDGGAISGGTQLNVTDCLFVYNGTPSFRYGGAIVCGGKVNVTVLTGCTFIANESGHGGAVYAYGTEPKLTIAHCILWGDSPNELESENQVTGSATFSDIEGGYDGEGNIDADPLFVRNPDPDNGDYGDLRLQSNSPCIDAGDPNYAPAPGETDLAGLFRVWDGDGDRVAIIDMGSYEFASFAYGDLNCDGLVDFNDIDAFVDALVGTDEYAQNYPRCNVLLGDTNADALVDFNDIDAFVECLVNNGCP